MKAAIFTLNTGLYKAKKDSAAATALKDVYKRQIRCAASDRDAG